MPARTTVGTVRRKRHAKIAPMPEFLAFALIALNLLWPPLALYFAYKAVREFFRHLDD